MFIEKPSVFSLNSLRVRMYDHPPIYVLTLDMHFKLLLVSRTIEKEKGREPDCSYVQPENGNRGEKKWELIVPGIPKGLGTTPNIVSPSSLPWQNTIDGTGTKTCCHWWPPVKIKYYYLIHLKCFRQKRHYFLQYYFFNFSSFFFSNVQSVSARVLTFFWWFFCLIIVLVYLVSLHTMLYQSVTTSPNAGQVEQQKTLQALIQNDDVTFGVVKNMATAKMLKVGERKRSQGLNKNIQYILTTTKF